MLELQLGLSDSRAHAVTSVGRGWRAAGALHIGPVNSPTQEPWTALPCEQASDAEGHGVVGHSVQVPVKPGALHIN